ncbi:uncharacterized protein LOC122387995 [Amphibalanus amphitrite]|uniref:uncharacterized protein LOC122387995 n=1 Tax=Amphibalanus amphitrite TaxID=1232801 RepID=UPI001C906A73|nr:uncharacterized protein LOC122387995 [Amphibalanus amphitrite]
MAGTIIGGVILAAVITASAGQLYHRSDYGGSSNYNSNSNTGYYSSRSSYDTSSLDYGNIYGSRSPSTQTYTVPPPRSPASRLDYSSQRLQLAYDAYLRELRTASALREGRRDPLQPAHDLQPAAQHTDPAAAPIERSDSYGYGDDCSDLDTLSMILGLGALAAFALYYYLQQQAAAAPARSSVWMPMMSVIQNRLPEHVVLESLLEKACGGLDVLETRRSSQWTQRGVTGRGIGGDCLEGLIGPAAGFSALAAIVAYALAQAAMAMAGARSSDTGVDYTALNSAARQMLIALTAPDQCVAHQLCQVTRSAGHASAQTRTPIKLASVALAWYAARLRQTPGSTGPYSEYCWSLVHGLNGTCPDPSRACIAT